MKIKTRVLVKINKWASRIAVAIFGLWAFYVIVVAGPVVTTSISTKEFLQLYGKFALFPILAVFVLMGISYVLQREIESRGYRLKKTIFYW